jgi:16S rRNA (guanine966-N2)-methyltransferase
MVRIISGYYKGRLLKTNNNPTLRPTRDRVKETLFSVLGDIEDLRVADLFAGCGNLGLEAISRGAKSCAMVEKDIRQIRLIQENVSKLELDEHVEIHRMDAIRFLKMNSIADLILADPPYNYRCFDKLFQVFENQPEVTQIVLEAGKDLQIPVNLIQKMVSQKIISETSLNIFKV